MEVPLLVLAVVFLPIFIVPLAFDLTKDIHQTIDVIDWIIWAIFAFDLLLRTYLAENKFGYLKNHPFDILIVLLPFLRPLRFLRILRGGKILTFLRLIVTLLFIGRTINKIAKRRGVQISIAFGFIVFIISSVLLYAVERNSGSPIENLGDALWWAIATLTNVGAGDVTPQSGFGKGIGVFLMISGVSVFTSLVGNIAAVLLEEDRDTNELKNELSLLKLEIRKHNEIKHND